MKTWDCQVSNKQELTTDLMFLEIMQLRKQSAGLATHLSSLIEDLERLDSNKLTTHIKERIKKAKEFRASL